MKDRKGNGALLRNLNDILMDATAEETKSVLKLVEAKNPLVVMQMQNMYRHYSRAPRTFRFTRHERVRIHKETERKNALSLAKVSLYLI